MTDTTIGIPSPPFLIIAPKGAPIKNNITHAKERANFLWYSILCLLRYSVSSLKLS